MYTPLHFDESRPEVLANLIGAHPLGALVSHGDAGLSAEHIPFEYAAPSVQAPFGTLRAHVARANPVWRREGEDVMVLFQGASAYVSPSLYEEKPRSGKVVPTWNYAVVHGHGVLRAIDDPAWVLALLQRLTARHEAPRAQPWAVSDAPPAFVAALLEAIVGIEIVLTRLDGKWKMSQNRTPADRLAIAADSPLLAPSMMPPST